jgi:hypothetical protein
LPAFEASQSSHVVEDQTRDRRRDDRRQRITEKIKRVNFSSVLFWKPGSHVVDKARYESGFSETERKPQCVETHRTYDQSHCHRCQTPSDHDARQPAVRAVAYEQNVAGHFKEKVSPEEHSRAETINGWREAQIFVHGQGGKSNVHAIDVGDEIHSNDHPHEPLFCFIDHSSG